MFVEPEKVFKTLNSKPSKCCGGRGKKKAGGLKCPICDFRRLWIEHVALTREVGALTLLQGVVPENLKSALTMARQPTLDRLLRNQDDIGNWIGQALRSRAIASAVAKLLREHIELALPVVVAVRDGNKEEEKRASAAWHKNADDIAKALSDIGRKYRLNWRYTALRHMMFDHLRLLSEEVVGFDRGLKGDPAGYNLSIRKFDESVAEIIEMADMLVHGAGLRCRC